MLSKLFFQSRPSFPTQKLFYSLLSRGFSQCLGSPQSFKVEQLFTRCLSEFAYYIESNGEAAIIDPLRDIKGYIQLAEKNNTKIKYVLETHFHADFVSGHVELASKTGAKIVYGPKAECKFPAHIANDGEELRVGNITLKVLHTPGHTLESSCYLLLDESRKPYCIFTGDTLFLGEVGRPDLAVNTSEFSQEELAGMLYDSLRSKVFPLPDHTLVYPGHGEGSFCGKSISRGKVDTLGKQKKINYGMRLMSRDKFVKTVLTDLPAPPKYFYHDVSANKEGSPSLEELIKRSKVPLSYEEFQHKVKEEVKILDCRDSQEFAEGHIPGSVNVGLDMPFAAWVASLLDLKNKLVLVTEPGKEEEAIVRLARVGYDNVLGYLQGGMETWIEKGKGLQTMNIIKPSEFKSKLDQNINIIDVRSPNEWRLGFVKGAKLIQLKELCSQIEELNKDLPYYLYCKVGGRSQIAYSVMKSQGFKSLYTVQGGIDRIVSEGIDLFTI